MQRDRRLYPLSRGHHHALLFALRANRTLQTSDTNADRTVAEKLRVFWPTELQPHLRAEEEILFPAAVGVAGVEDALAEHRQLVDLFVAANGGGEEIREILQRFACLLTSHVRFEEDVLFPRIESFVSEEVFDVVGGELTKKLPNESKTLPAF